MDAARLRQPQPGQGIALRLIGRRVEQPLRRTQRQRRLAGGPGLQLPQPACKPPLDRREISAEGVLRKCAVGTERRQGAPSVT
jgi:hypothetical protein